MPELAYEEVTIVRIQNLVAIEQQRVDAVTDRWLSYRTVMKTLRRGCSERGTRLCVAMEVPESALDEPIVRAAFREGVPSQSIVELADRVVARSPTRECVVKDRHALPGRVTSRAAQQAGE